ncbi:MAG: alpha/beta fold hydrolase [Bryobacteraceae bacterium]
MHLDREIAVAGRGLWVRGIPAGTVSPVLVFLHEGLGCSELWRRFPDEVCAAVNLPGLVYDRWGYGRSEARPVPWPPSYLDDEAAGHLPELLAAVGVHDVYMIGHSDGGTIALRFAAAPPREVRVRGVVTEAAHVVVEEFGLSGIRETVDRYRTADLPERLSRYHGDKAEAVFRGWSETWLSPAFRDFQILDHLPHITCPVLAIQGRDDEYGTHAQVDHIAQKVPLASTLWIAGCGHAPHREAQQLTLAAICGFIRQVQSEKHH